MNSTLYSSHSLISLAPSETPCGPAQLRGSLQPCSIISSYPLPTLLQPERLFLTSSFWNAVRGAAEYWRWAFCSVAPPFHHCVLPLHFQLHPVHPHISSHHLDSFLGCLWAVVREYCDNIFGRQVSSGVWGKALICLDEFVDVHYSEDWGTHGAQESHLLSFLHNGEWEELNELPLIVCMIGRGVGRRSSAGGESGLAWGSSNGWSGMATGAGGGCGLRVFSWSLGTG